ncbi:UV radiation resistance protein and autophagy-related subunit 14-domain-containing protein [Microdochium trichocladiopsis]|uniref:Autophagy-related protein 14 n=1 Tax=Microdochium trichocladiopsis TaxID=1682393 RepID=A0A9P8Y2H0_9PEZI|nr:UV radiation resistance protein and autophagy-related subunit 14-domain-containing protein [Microdochium trichocladiopsis]KAH7027678.1 UV radiation resistance protein and autophagy-related subunit 14-domain-containing protein [Microdochium trichocladiopsis]
MNCDICQRGHHPAKLPFLCVVDARNALYPGRISHAQVLIESETLESRINKLLSDGDGSSSGARAEAQDLRIHVENCASKEAIARERTEQIIASADKLRQEIDMAKKQIQERRAKIARQRTDLAAASSGVDARRKRELEETKKTIRMTKYSWDREYEGLTQYRAALCLEVAKLYRLQRVKRGGPLRYDYRIGGIDIVDLHQLNSAQPELISASLGHISHLLWLTSHYLAIRLPAELTLPHNDYPRPTIFSLVSSYHHGNVAFPGSSPLPPDPLDRQFQHVPHPRPLYIDRPLAALMKEDPSAFNSFIEAVSLLAYDIVWLCRTQGVPVADSLEDFASIGRNMYNLLINSSMHRGSQQQPLSPPDASTGDSPEQQHADLAKTAPRMGLYSHGTMHTSLATAAGNKLTRSFAMVNPIKLADQLKAKLAHEMYPTAEWELVQNDGFVPEGLEDAVMVGGTPPTSTHLGSGGESGGARYGLESFMSVQNTGAGASVAPPREKSHGWTKIRARTPG